MPQNVAVFTTIVTLPAREANGVAVTPFISSAASEKNDAAGAVFDAASARRSAAMSVLCVVEGRTHQDQFLVKII